jgi:hypothetical protein
MHFKRTRVTENWEKSCVSHFQRPCWFFAFFRLGVGEKQRKRSAFGALISPTHVSPPKIREKAKPNRAKVEIFKKVETKTFACQLVIDNWFALWSSD